MYHLNFEELFGRRYVPEETMQIVYEYNGTYPIPKGQVAIARDFAIVLSAAGYLTLLGRNDDFVQLCRKTSSRLVKAAATYDGYMALTEEACIVTYNIQRKFDIEGLNQVKDIAAGEGHIVALFNDGTVKSIDECRGYESAPQHNNTVSKWHNMQQVAVGFYNVMGLTNDGKVLYHSEDPFTDKNYYSRFDDIVQVDCYSHYYGDDYSAVLHRNGKVSSESFEGVEEWEGIIQISVGADIIVGLKADGTIEMIDNRNERYAAKEWRDLTYVECKFFGVVGITRIGEILSLNDN